MDGPAGSPVEVTGVPRRHGSPLRQCGTGNESVHRGESLATADRLNWGLRVDRQYLLVENHNRQPAVHLSYSEP